MLLQLGNAFKTVYAVIGVLSDTTAHVHKAVADTYPNRSVAFAERLETFLQQEAASFSRRIMKRVVK